MTRIGKLRETGVETPGPGPPTAYGVLRDKGALPGSRRPPLATPLNRQSYPRRASSMAMAKVRKPGANWRKPGQNAQQ